jgi:hypothetical protein
MKPKITLIDVLEPDGTLRYTCDAIQDIAVRVAIHQRNGSKRCPVELLHQGEAFLETESDLGNLRDIETLFKHASEFSKDIPWHQLLTTIGKALPKHTHKPWASVTLALEAYTMERKEYLWYPGLPKGEPVGLDGDPGVGKSAMLVKVITHLTTGIAFPTLFPERPEQAFEPGTVVLFTYEDDPGSTILPRVLINGGDPSRVQIVEGKRDPETGAVSPMTLQDVALLENLLKQYTPVLMAFDPIQSFFGPGVDMNKANDTRPVLDAVRNLCKAHGCTPLYVRHNGKSQRSKALHTTLGSIDITANFRSTLALYKDPNDPQRRILAQTKSNGPTAPSMQLKLVGATYDADHDDGEIITVEDVRVDWDGLSDLTAEDLNARECVHGNDTEEAQSALDHAREFLREVLDAPMRVDELLQAAKQAGLKRRTLDRAKDKEGVKARRVPMENTPANKWPWEWYYPTGRG